MQVSNRKLQFNNVKPEMSINQALSHMDKTTF